MILRNPIKDIAIVASIITVATGAFIKYVKWYERKYGSNKNNYE